MKRFTRFLAALVALLLCVGAAAACGEDGLDLPQLDDFFTQRDLLGSWEPSATKILLTGDSAETSSHVVNIDGGTVTILDGGVYMLTGTLDDGSIVVDVSDDERVQLVLNGVSVTSSDSAAIRVLQADKVFITLAEGTENTLANGGAFDESGDANAVICSDEDLTFNGAGTLIINAPAGDGIDGNDDVKFASGTYVITAAGRAVNANDSLRIAGGHFTVVSDGDAFRADHDSNADLGYIYIWGGTFDITTGGGAANGTGNADDMGGMMPGGFDPQAMGGEMPTAPEGFTEGEMPTPPEGFTEGEMPTAPEGFTEGEMPTPPEGFTEGEMPTPPENASEAAGADAEDAVSAKGFKASGNIAVLGGTYSLDTADDAFHANGDLLVFDGDLTIESGDDGLHAHGDLTIVGGSVDIEKSSEGLEAEVISILGGDIRVTASDDGLNARSSTGEKETFEAQEGVSIDIAGGTLCVNASGDGIDSNGDIHISGGTIVVSGPVIGANGALDCNGVATVSGGTILAAGASGMAENFSGTSTQAAFLAMLEGEAGAVTVSNAQGNVVFSADVEKSFATVVVSCPELAVGETYTVASGENAVEITLTDVVTGSDTGGMGGMAGPMQGMPGPGGNSAEPPAFGAEGEANG